jgi:hypothetical protein
MLVAVGTAACIILPVATASPASAQQHRHLTMAQRTRLAREIGSAMRLHPADLPIGSATIKTKNGNQLCVATPIQASGHPVIEHVSGCEPMYDTITGTDVNGFPKYYWEANQFGPYMAATNDCTKVTLKQDTISNGVVWILWVDQTGEIVKLFPQYCNASGVYVNAFSGDNTAGNQFLVRTGGYQALDFVFH